VGDTGPSVEIRSFSNVELNAVRKEIESAIMHISELSFEEFSAGNHCRWCAHNQLPCAPDGM